VGCVEMALTTLPREEQRTPQSRLPWPRPEVPWVPERRHVLWGLVLVAAIIAASVFVLQSAGRTSYQATIEDVLPYGSSQVIVSIQVKNLGGSPATPTCTVNMTSPAGAFSGEGTLKATQPIPGGSWATYSVIIPVTSNGATHVDSDSSSVGCH
jgi:hypothetical protein